MLLGEFVECVAIDSTNDKCVFEHFDMLLEIFDVLVFAAGHVQNFGQCKNNEGSLTGTVGALARTSEGISH